MTRPRPGMTLIEAMVSMAVLAIMLVGSLNLLGASARLRRSQVHDATGMMLAQELISEIVQLPYDDPEAPAQALGPELSESGPARSAFDDADDYAGWTASPPVTRAGAPKPGGSGWRRSVQVTHASSADLSTAGYDTGLKRITVTVTSPTGHSTVLTALRARVGLHERPAENKNASVWLGIEIVEGSPHGARYATGAAMLNDPGANVVRNGDFASGTDHWYPTSDGFGPTAALAWQATGGMPQTPILLVGARASSSAGVLQDLTGFLRNGAQHLIEMEVRSQLAPQTLEFGFRITSTGSGTQTFSATGNADNNAWGILSRTTIPSWSGTLVGAEFFVRSTAGTDPFLLGEVAIEEK